MTKAWQYRSPDARLRDLDYARQREEERRTRLDEMYAQRQTEIGTALERERQRGLELDEQFNRRQMQVEQGMQREQARKADLEAREAQQFDMAGGLPAIREWPEPRPWAEGQYVTRRDSHGPLVQGLKTAAEAAYEHVVEPTFKAVEYVEKPTATAAIQAVSRSGPLGGPALGPSQQIGETPMERRPIGEDLVNPVAMWLGDEEEQRKAEEVLAEAGLPATLMAYFFSSPLNALPIVGFTKADDFIMALRRAAKVTGEARTAIVRSPSFQSTIRAISSEAGGGKLPKGKPPAGLSARDSAIEKLSVAGKTAAENFEKNVQLANETFGQRAVRGAELRDRLIAQGMSRQDAILHSTAELRGPYPFKAVTGIDFTPQEEAWFFDQVIQNARYGEAANVAKYFKDQAARIAAGEPIKDFPPFVWRNIEKAVGVDFTNQLKKAVEQQAKVVNEAAKRTAEQKMAKPPRGVSFREALPPEYGAEQLPIRRAPETGGAIPPPRTFWEEEQFRTAMRLGEPARRPTPVNVPESVAAEQGIFYPGNPGFPPPGAALKDVIPEQRALLIDVMADSVGILRPILASSDLSWFRQTGKTIARHPVVTKESLVKGTKAFGSEKFATDWMAVLKAEGVTTEGYRQVIRTKEGVREIGLGRLLEDRFMAVPGTPEFAQSTILQRPEFYASRAAVGLPLVKQSGRAFAVGWNTQYAGVTRYWLGKVTKLNHGALSMEQVDAALNLAERLMGKGELGTSWFARALKALGFAPGYRMSGPQAFVTLLSPRTDPLVRRMAAEHLLSWGALGASITSLAKYAAGATVVSAIGASQFGRIKFPGSDTYYNIWGTDNVLARAIMQAISQRRVDVRGNVSRVGTGEKTPAGFLTAIKDALTYYLRSGEDPVVGLLTDIASGTTYIGEPLTWDVESAWKVVRDRLPMVWQDMMDMVQTDGPIQAILSSPAAITGVAGISSWTPLREEFRAIPKYNTADEAVVEKILGRDVPEPLSLSANEERDLQRFLQEDVRGWVEEMEDKYGPMPSDVSYVKVIQKVGKEKGLTSREIAGAIFLHKARSRMEQAINTDWLKFALLHRDELEPLYPERYDADYMQLAQQRAEERGLVPAR